VFRFALQLAARRDMPVVIHCRDAWEDCFSILREVCRPPIRGVLHCFTGGPQELETALGLGLFISFAGNLTFPNARNLREVARKAPMERIVVETDAPYLSPQPYRARRNEPAWIVETCRALAEAKQLALKDVERITTVNAHRLFGVGPSPEKGKVAYAIRDSLYLNVTNACTDRCVFCALSDPDFWVGKGDAPFVKGHHLRLARDPTAGELLLAAGDPRLYQEIVFCGYGEPTIRLDTLLQVGRALKARGARWIRLDTNGHGDLIHQRPIAQTLAGVVDEVSVSLNAATAEQYVALCRPTFGLATYGAIKAFIRACKGVVPRVTATVVAMPGVDVEVCRRIATEELGVQYRVRPYNEVG